MRSGRRLGVNWRASWKDDDAQLLLTLRNGETTQLQDPKIEDNSATAALQRRHPDRGDACWRRREGRGYVEKLNAIKFRES
jgi:hypothetical protein